MYVHVTTQILVWGIFWWILSRTQTTRCLDSHSSFGDPTTFHPPSTLVFKLFFVNVRISYVNPNMGVGLAPSFCSTLRVLFFRVIKNELGTCNFCNSAPILLIFSLRARFRLRLKINLRVFPIFFFCCYELAHGGWELISRIFWFSRQIYLITRK